LTKLPATAMKEHWWCIHLVTGYENFNMAIVAMEIL